MGWEEEEEKGKTYGRGLFLRFFRGEIRTIGDVRTRSTAAHRGFSNDIRKDTIILHSSSAGVSRIMSR
jgi:hypothetical protein